MAYCVTRRQKNVCGLWIFENIFTSFKWWKQTTFWPDTTWRQVSVCQWRHKTWSLVDQSALPGSRALRWILAQHLHLTCSQLSQYQHVCMLSFYMQISFYSDVRFSIKLLLLLALLLLFSVSRHLRANKSFQIQLYYITKLVQSLQTDVYPHNLL